MTTLYYNANGGINRYDAATGHDKWINWNTRGKPTRISKGTTENQYQARDTFAYGIDGARYYRKAEWYDSQNIYNLEHTFYVGNYEDVVNQSSFDYSRMEKTNLGGLISIRGARLNGTVENTTEFTLTDHLGSIETVIDSSGNALHLAYDPFGERRDNNWRGIVTTLELEAIEPRLRKSTRRGYTGHEHLDRTGLIHMNGRVYDPTLGRFISPDPFVQAPHFSQSYNRYSYVWNNPVVRYDPTGYVSQNYTSSTGSPSLSSFGGSNLEEDKKKKRDWDDDCAVNCEIIEYTLGTEDRDSRHTKSKKDTQGEVGGSDGQDSPATVGSGGMGMVPYSPVGEGGTTGAQNHSLEEQEQMAVLIAMGLATNAVGELAVASVGWFGRMLGLNGATQGGVWSLSPIARGSAIEAQLAKTDYKDWFNVGQLNKGKFPLVDFQKGNTLVSLKSADTTGSSWVGRMEQHIEDLGTRGATINGSPANMILDLRVQPGGAHAATQLVDYGRQFGVNVIIKEF